MIEKRFNKKRPGWNNSKPGFTGYKKGYEPKLKKFRDTPEPYQVNEKAIKMLTQKEDKISGNQLSSGMKAHRIGTDKLKSLNFDPIEVLLQQLEEIDELLQKELQMTEPRVMVVNNFINAKVRILENLLPYGYGKAPVVTVADSDVRDPIKIILTIDDQIED